MMGLFNRPKPMAQKSFAAYELMPSISWTAKWSEFSAYQGIRQGYKRSTWVYACVSLRSRTISSVPWIVERQTADGFEELPNHPLTELLQRPNATYDWPMMMRIVQYWLDLTGDAWISKVRNGAGRVVELWPLMPDKMEVLPGRDTMIAGYKYHKSSVTRTIPPEDIIHLRYVNPADAYFGLAPLQAAARAVDIDEEAEKWQKLSLQNMAVPPGALIMEGDVTQQQYEQAKRSVKEQSGPEHAREAWVLANAKWQQMGQNAVDLDFIPGRRLIREEICAAFNVPPPLVGIYDNATLSNIETARKILWREGLIPALEEIEAQINLQLVEEQGIRIRYDISGVQALRDDMTEKVNNARQLFAMGVPFSQINEILELGVQPDSMPNFDVGYLTAGMIPTDMDAAEVAPGNSQLADEVAGEA